MIKIFSIKKSSIPFFSDAFSKEYFDKNDIVFTNNPWKADLFCSISAKSRSFILLKLIFFYKRFITWTNEPRHDFTSKEFINRKNASMNVYSGNVFLHNLHFLGSYHHDFSNSLGINLNYPPGLPLTIESLQKKSKFCLAVFSYRDPETSALLLNGINIDLFTARQELASFFHTRNKADIVGGNWPQNIRILESSGYESGGNTWWDRKLMLLSDYKFNICFENTISPYYCTEKIWHAIAAGCLPIYYGAGTKIRETFPDNSFIDASEFKSNDELLNYIENLSPEEHIMRYNKCLTTMHNSCSQRLLNPDLKTDILEVFVSVVKKLTK